MTLNFKGDPSRPVEVCAEDREKLEAAGLFWELFPDAPAKHPQPAPDAERITNDTQSPSMTHKSDIAPDAEDLAAAQASIEMWIEKAVKLKEQRDEARRHAELYRDTDAEQFREKPTPLPWENENTQAKD